MPEAIQQPPCQQPSCLCEQGLFQSQKDLSELYIITKAIAQEISFTLPHPDTHAWWTSPNPRLTTKDICHYLNTGVTDEIYERWICCHDEMEHWFILFVALAMQLGAFVPAAYRKLVRNSYCRYLRTRRQMDQFKDALIHYDHEIGPWDFDMAVTEQWVVEKIAKNVVELYNITHGFEQRRVRELKFKTID